MGKHVQQQDGGAGPGRDLSQNEALGKAAKKQRRAQRMAAAAARKVEPMTMAEAMLDPTNHPTPTNIARVEERPVDRGPKPALIRCRIKRVFENHDDHMRGYAFAKPLDANAEHGDVFCRIGSGRTIIVTTSDTPRFSDESCGTPREGDEIMTWALLTERGLSALRWGSAEQWDRALQMIRTRITYRCVELKQYLPNGNTNERILVVNADKRSLNEQFPRIFGGGDELKPEERYGHWHVRRHWERRTLGSNWTPCADPRTIRGNQLRLATAS